VQHQGILFSNHVCRLLHRVLRGDRQDLLILYKPPGLSGICCGIGSFHLVLRRPALLCQCHQCAQYRFRFVHDHSYSSHLPQCLRHHSHLLWMLRGRQRQPMHAMDVLRPDFCGIDWNGRGHIFCVFRKCRHLEAAFHGVTQGLQP